MRFYRASLFIALTFLLGFAAATPIQSFVKGSFAEIQAKHQQHAHIIMFWGEDCAYCMKELEMAGELLPQYPNIALITVSTDPFLDDAIVRNKLSEFGLEETESWVFASDYPETLYFDVDKRWRGELPLTFFINDQGDKVKKAGLVKFAAMKSWLDSQTQPE